MQGIKRRQTDAAYWSVRYRLPESVAAHIGGLIAATVAGVTGFTAAAVSVVAGTASAVIILPDGGILRIGGCILFQWFFNLHIQSSFHCRSRTAILGLRPAVRPIAAQHAVQVF